MANTAAAVKAASRHAPSGGPRGLAIECAGGGGEGAHIRGPRRFDDFDIRAMEDAERRRDYRVMGSGETENAMRAAVMTGAAGWLVRYGLAVVETKLETRRAVMGLRL